MLEIDEIVTFQLHLISVVGNESDRESQCYSFESHCGWEFFVLEFSLASRSSHLDTTKTNEIKHGITPL